MLSGCPVVPLLAQPYPQKALPCEVYAQYLLQGEPEQMSVEVTKTSKRQSQAAQAVTQKGRDGVPDILLNNLNIKYNSSPPTG